MNRSVKIIGAGLVGAFIGSSIGIAAMGNAIAGTVPVSALMAYLAYLLTKDHPSQTIQEVAKPSDSVSPADATSIPEQDPLKAMEKAVNDAVPLMIKFLGASWNLLMKLLISIGVMPIFLRTPWLLIVLIVVMVAIIPPVGIFFFVAGLAANDKGATADNNFMMPL